MKRLIVCCDGTWQDLECPYPTNVVKIAQAIDPIAKDGISQVFFYDEGIGTGGSTEVQKQIDRVAGGAIGKGIDKNIQDGYWVLVLRSILGSFPLVFIPILTLSIRLSRRALSAR